MYRLTQWQLDPDTGIFVATATQLFDDRAAALAALQASNDLNTDKDTTRFTLEEFASVEG